MILTIKGVAFVLTEQGAVVDVDPTDNTLDIAASAGNDAVGAGLATLVTANLNDLNTLFPADVNIQSCIYNPSTDQLVLTYEAGQDVTAASEGGALPLEFFADTGTSFFNMSAATNVNGSNGGADYFTFYAAQDNVPYGKDTINFFEVGSDRLDLWAISVGGSAPNLLNGAGPSGDIAANAAAIGVGDQGLYTFADGADGTGTEAIANYSDLADVAAFLDAAFTGEAANTEFVAVINDLTGNRMAYVYYVDLDGGANATSVEAADIQLIGVVDIQSTAVLTIASGSFV